MPYVQSNLKQRVQVLHAAHRVVVEHDAADPAIFGQSTSLWLDLLGGEHSLHGGELR